MARYSRAWPGALALACAAALALAPGATARATVCDIVGTPGPDVLNGTSAGEVICGLGGDDILRGGGGRDRLIGGRGRDTIIGGRGRDRLIAGPGRDLALARGGGPDRVICGPGRDQARSGRGDRHRSCERRSRRPWAGPLTRARKDRDHAARGSDCDTRALAASLSVSGCSVLFADQSTDPDHRRLWGSHDCERRERVRRPTGGADPHSDSNGRPPADDRFRRLRAIDGDDVWGQRCEIGANDHRTSPTALYGPGERRLTFTSFRVPRTLPLSLSRWQVVMQMKQSQPSANGGGTPVLALNVYAGRWRLHQSTSTGPSGLTREIWSAPAEPGVWARFAFDVTYSSDPDRGSVRIYADLNGDGDAADTGEQSPRIRTYTLKRETAGGTDDGIAPGEPIPSHLRVGMYNAPSIDCPPPSGCSVDVDNVQVVDAKPSR